MPSKVQYYAELADRQARSVTGSREKWTNFLETAGRLYKYPFDEQLMIHAQRPDARACASFDFWHEPMNRYIKGGAKGIALLDMTNGKPSLKYVYDYTDTEDGRRNPHRPFIWELKPEHEQSVINSLAANYELAENNIGNMLYDLAESLSARYYNDNARDIQYSVEGSFLEDYDEYNVEIAFKEAMTISTAYTLMTRCGIDPAEYITDEEFQPIFDFNSPTSVYALGKAVSTVTEEVLRDIEVTIKKYERERSVNHERTDIHQTRRLSVPEYSVDGGSDRTSRQIRNDENGLFETTPSDTVHDIYITREDVPALSGDRTDSDRTAVTDNDGIIGERPAARQSDRPDGVDGSHERAEIASGGNNLNGIDLQLNEITDPQAETPPDEQSDGVFTSNGTVTEAEIYEYLKSGSNIQNSKYRIFSFFLHDHDTKEKADFLKDEYGYSGRTYIFADGERGSADTIPSAGIVFTKNDVKTNLTWTNAANHIDRLIADGEYMSQSELNRLPVYERQILGSEIINFYSNLPEEIIRPFPDEYAISTDYWNNARKIGDMLDNSDYLAAILESMRPIMEKTPAIDRHYDTRKKSFDDLTAFADGNFTLFPNAETQTLIFPTLPTEQEQIKSIRQAEEAVIASQPAVITQEDIDRAIIEWNGDNDSKSRVFNFMLENGRARNTADFLKSEYGGDLQAFTVEKDGAESITLSWQKVQRNIGLLMESGLFVLPDEQTQDYIAVEQSEPEAIETPSTEQSDPISEQPSCPPPVFFVDWDKSQFDFDLKLYNDHDIIGYNKDGVEYMLGRSGSLTYVTSTGMFWGGNAVPGNIYEQINAYLNGEISDEQVRENYLSVLETYKNQINDVFVQSSVELPQKEYVLSYRYVNENLVIFNDVDPDEIDILARVAPDGSKTFLDENLPQWVINEITAITEADVSRYRESDNARWQQFSDNVQSITEEYTQRDEPQDSQISLFDYPIAETPVKSEVTETITDTSTPRRPQIPAVNFRITDDHLGEGGAKTKYGYNVAAIRTLQAIEAENRRATPEEQEILSRYVGWGGIQQAFDKDNKQWEREYAELNGLLTPDEYKLAQASTLNAHYTSPVVIKAMYETLGRLGFKDGNILEPACGVGNFFGLLPENMQNSKLYGVELDSITGRIAKQLYPNADIKVTGFEKTETPDAFFDVAIGNVPFGSYTLNDPKYNKNNFLIHDYFFAKALDQVRPGGIVAFVTSKGTLDKANPEVRKYLAQRAELLGAVRLPNTAFQKNAGTEVTTDIIFLQKRDRLIDIEPEWVHLGQTDNGIPVNSYFADNPHMMLGTMSNDSGLRMYGNENVTSCIPFEGADLAEQLKTALSYIQGQITEVELDDLADEVTVRASIPADPLVKNFSYALITPADTPDNVDGQIYARKVGEGDVYFRENSRMYPVDMPAATLERVKGMIALRDITHKLIQYQLDDYPDNYIRSAQSELNRLYDDFTRKHGLINHSANSKAFSADSSYYLLCSLEILNENNELARKSDMFTKRTIRQNTVITSVDTSTEALAVSIAQKARVDMDYMAELTGFTPEKIAADLQGVIFLNPMTRKYEPADEYLSGNVRHKLDIAKQAAENDPVFAVNVKALEQAQPKDLDASEIAVRLGATWVDKGFIQEFMYELLQTPGYYRGEIKVNYSELTDEWNISGKNRVSYNDPLATSTYGTERANAYKIIEETLNLKDVRVYDTKIEDGKEKRVLNKKETMLACQRQEAIKGKFKDWIFQKPERRQYLIEKYNRLFNSTRPREYDGSHINFAGISPEISLKSHQTAAIARILYGGNTLLAHEVGAGKTFEMVGAAMESKRLGLCQKSMMAVPNHLTEQMASEFLRLYPSANILVATKKDFETKNRKKFCAKIATGDYDCVIIGHSQLEKIPLSKERQERLLWEQIDEITAGIEELKNNNGERFSIKQMEKTKKNLEARLEKLTDDSKKDSVVTFEQLGVDRLFVDESHNFKEL